MKALILAAGRGRRLWPLTAECPKCLLDIGGTTILEHQLGNLTAAGIGRVVVICGHGVEGVRQALAAYVGRADVSIIYNPFFAEADNLISLWAARSEMDADFLLLNGDNVFHPLILPRLLSMEASACVAVRRQERYDEDDAKVQLADQRVVRIGKNLTAGPTHAESIGILRFAGRGVPAIRRALEEAVMADGARHSLSSTASRDSSIRAIQWHSVMSVSCRGQMWTPRMIYAMRDGISTHSRQTLGQAWEPRMAAPRNGRDPPGNPRLRR